MVYSSHLIVEGDITHTDIDKTTFYASIGVPEFWRFDGETWRIYHLQNDSYEEVEVSPTFPIVPKECLYRFLAEAKEDEIEAALAFPAQSAYRPSTVVSKSSVGSGKI